MSVSTKIVDVTLHIDENVSTDDREKLRDDILKLDGVMAADHHDEKPHLMLVEYDPDAIDSSRFLEIAKQHGLRVELIGL